MFEGIGQGVTLGGGGVLTVRTLFQSGNEGNSASLPLAVHDSIDELKVYGFCSQNGTPTPVNPVPVVCNNGEVKYGWRDIITSSQLSGYGTYVSPTQGVQTRAYRWFENLPNGTYTFAVDGDYEIIVQWRDPADPDDGVAQFYENLTGWITSGVVTLNKSTGGYGVAVRRTDGTTITPDNFDGTLHVQKQKIYIDGTQEQVTISAAGETDVVLNVGMLLALPGYVDFESLVENMRRKKVGVTVFDGTESWSKLSNVNGYYTVIDVMKVCKPVEPGFSTHFVGTDAATSSMPNNSIKNTYASGTGGSKGAISIRYNDASTITEFTAMLAAQYAAGKPVMAFFPLAEEATEQTAPQAVNNPGGDITVSVNKTNTFNRNLFDGYYKKAVL